MRNAAFPGARFEVYPERRQAPQSALDRFGAARAAWLTRRLRHRPGWRARLLRAVKASEAAGAGIAAGRLARELQTLRWGLRRSGFQDELLCRCLGLVCVLATRHLGVRPSDLQILASGAILKGAVVDFDWGESRNLVAAMAASAVALAGVPVHVVTRNEALARLALTETLPLFEALGVEAAVAHHAQDADRRRAAYKCDVTYVDARELVFDYLRDLLVLGRVNGPLRARIDRLRGRQALCSDLRLRGLWFAIVDDADEVLIDDAVRPLALFGDAPVPDPLRWAREALQAAGRLEEGLDYGSDPRQLCATLTERGRSRLGSLGPALGGPWTNETRREELVSRALLALRLMTRGRDYTVSDGRLRLAAGSAGQVAPEPGWPDDMQGLLEVKEGLAPVVPRQPLARISLQRFFRRYLRLSGIAGAAHAAAGELRANYGVAVVRLATVERRGPRARARICPDVERKWDALARRAGRLHERGSPVLIALESASAAESLAARLTASGVKHTVLGLEGIEKDATTLERPGGADGIAIVAGAAAQDAGSPLFAHRTPSSGLHLLVAEQSQGVLSLNRLVGRSLRSGVPRSIEVFASADDISLSGLWGGMLIWMARRAAGDRWPASRFAADHLLRLLLIASGREKARARRALASADEQAAVTLAFAGRHGI